MSASKSFRLPHIISALAAVGIALAFISLYHHTAINNDFDLGKSAFCNISATLNCDAVNQSRYSYLFGIPVASYGIWFYFGLMLFSFVIRGVGLIERQTADSVALVLGLIGFLVSVVFFLISELLIHVLCPTCLGMYAVNGLCLLAALISGRGRSVITRISDGATALLRAPLTLLVPRTPEIFRTASFSALLLLFSGYAAITLPDVILVRLLLPTAMAKNEQAMAEKARELAKATVKEWQLGPIISIPLVTEGSPATIDFATGDPAAPIQIVEFSDFECPFCRQLYGGLDELIAQHRDKVRFVFRNFPIDNSCNPDIPNEAHHNACQAAIFTRCAGEQGKFWDAVAYLFTLEDFDHNAGKEAISAGIERGLDVLNLDHSAMQECIKSDRPRTKILADIQDAAKAGLDGTPFVVVNGKRVKTPTPDALREIFGLILKK